jgi:hypothetical protein
MAIFAPDRKSGEIYAARRCDHNPLACERRFIALNPSGTYKLPLVVIWEAGMKTLTWLISLFACVAIWSGSAAAQCTRHFYNNSNVPWTVGLASGGLCNGLPTCVVKPYTTSTLVYFPYPLSPIIIASPFYNNTFALSGCRINHSGNTGAIAVNEPADGDVTTCGRRGWRCPPIPRPRR